MLWKSLTPQKLSVVAILYLAICFLKAGYRLVVVNDFALISPENLRLVYAADIEPYVPGFRLIVKMWITIGLLWHFAGGRKAQQEKRYKSSLTDADRQLYELQKSIIRLQRRTHRRKKFQHFLRHLSKYHF